MILSPVSILDCSIAGVILAPQLLWTAGVFATLKLVCAALPLILFILPFHFLARYFKSRDAQPRFIRESSVFEDMIVRIVRHGFMYFPTEALKVFLSKRFAYPLLRWRMFRNGFFSFPAHLQERVLQEGQTSAAGLWIRHDPEKEADVVVYYVHGGGFALGSCYFYLEFLLAMHHLLLETRFENPAIFALEYSLVPEKTHPTQINQVVLGYKHVLEEVKDASKVCVAGDSAGGTLTLSLLRELGNRTNGHETNGTTILAVPRLAVLISPWITLVSNNHNPSRVDYLERDRLWVYGKAYAGSMVHDSSASPGLCDDGHLWKAVSPQRGYFVVHGEEETLAPDAEAFIRHQRRNKIEIDAMEFEGGIHAWPVASLLLSSTRDRRLQGLESNLWHAFVVEPVDSGCADECLVIVGIGPTVVVQRRRPDSEIQDDCHASGDGRTYVVPLAKWATNKGSHKDDAHWQLPTVAVRGGAVLFAREPAQTCIRLAGPFIVHQHSVVLVASNSPIRQERMRMVAPGFQASGHSQMA